MNVTTVQLTADRGWATGAGRALSFVGAVALMVIIVIGGAFAGSRLMGYQTLIVRTGSMTGTADVGSVVVGRPVTADEVQAGEIILLRRETAGRGLPPVLHRVIGREVDAFGEIVIRTKGDANTAPDPEPMVLRGRTVTPVFIVPHLGVVLAAVRTPAGWFGLILFPIVVAMSVSLCRLWCDPKPEDGD